MIQKERENGNNPSDDEIPEDAEWDSDGPEDDAITKDDKSEDTIKTED